MAAELERVNTQIDAVEKEIIDTKMELRIAKDNRDTDEVERQAMELQALRKKEMRLHKEKRLLLPERAPSAQVLSGAVVEALNRNVERLSTALAVLDSRLAAHEYSTLAPWAEIAPSSSRHRKEFRGNVVCLHYGSREHPAACMVSGVTLSGEKGVSGAHIWPAASRGQGLSKFGLEAADVHGARNGLLLLKVIEDAFDRLRVAIEVMPNDSFVFRVMDPALESSTVSGLTTFGQLNDRALTFPGQQRPFRRLLMWHLSHAVNEALKHNWRSEAYLERFMCLGPTGKVNAWLERLSPGSAWPGQQQSGVELVKVALKLSWAGDQAGSGSEADSADSDSS